MSKTFIFICLIYFALISLSASATACIDKLKAKNGKRRIPENTLMLLGLFGGAAAEYITMKIIRHKTRHNKFMIGLPLFILFHLALIVILIYMQK
ncbi:MAG: DUF1294 domain-containing protein [Acutalibacteraceae bacterium]